MFTSDEQNLTFTSQKNNKHETIPSRYFPEQKTKRSFVLRHLRPVREVLTKTFTTKLRLWTKFLACTVCALFQYMSVLFTSTSLGIHLCKQNLTNLQFSKRRRGGGICLSDALKLHRARGEHETQVTGEEVKGTMGRRKTAFYFPPSFARKFSSRERLLGTRQNKGSFVQIPDDHYP